MLRWAPLLLILLAAIPCMGQDGADRMTGTLSGSVTDDTKRPVGGATIRLLGTSPARGALTQDDGTFTIAGIGSDDYDIQITAVGYRLRLIRNVAIRDSQISTLRIILERQNNAWDGGTTGHGDPGVITMQENVGKVSRIRFRREEIDIHHSWSHP